MKVVDCILCLKGYHEWKLSGGIGIWRYGGIVKIASSSKRPASNLSRSGGSDQQMLEFVHLLSEVSLEECKVVEAQHSLFQHFVLRVVRAFLLEWSEAEDSPLDDMVGEFCLFSSSFFPENLFYLAVYYFLDKCPQPLAENNAGTLSQ
jgi:kinesin family member C2/C3